MRGASEPCQPCFKKWEPINSTSTNARYLYDELGVMNPFSSINPFINTFFGDSAYSPGTQHTQLPLTYHHQMPSEPVNSDALCPQRPVAPRPVALRGGPWRRRCAWLRCHLQGPRLLNLALRNDGYDAIDG